MESGLGRSYPLRAGMFVDLDLPWDIPVCRSCASVATTADGSRLLERGLRASLWRQARNRDKAPTAADLASSLLRAANGASPLGDWGDIAVDYLAELEENGLTLGERISEDRAMEMGERLLHDIESLNKGEAAPFRLPGALGEARGNLS